MFVERPAPPAEPPAAPTSEPSAIDREIDQTSQHILALPEQNAHPDYGNGGTLHMQSPAARGGPSQPPQHAPNPQN